MLTVGTTYKSESGETVEIVRYNPNGSHPFIGSNGDRYDTNGHSYHGSTSDLILDNVVPTPAEMIEAIYKHVKQADNVIRQRGGYPVYKRFIGVCPVEAYTDDEGYTHGIICPDLIHAYNTYGQSYGITLNDEETLLSLYRLMIGA